MHLVYPQNFTWPLASISLEIDSNTQEKLETMFMQFFFFFLGGGGRIMVYVKMVNGKKN